MKLSHRPASVSMSLVAVFAALNVITDLIPVSPVLGSSSRLTLGWVLSPLSGLMLGPVFGGVSCLIATLIEFLLGQPLVLGPAGLFRPALGAFQTGLLASERWKPSSAILAAIMVAWLALPTGRDAALILVFHLFGLALILILRGRMVRGLASQSRREVGLMVWAASYCGNVTRHLYGNLLFVVLAGLSPSIFLVAIPFTLVEQVFFSAASFAIGTALIRLKLRQDTYLG